MDKTQLEKEYEARMADYQALKDLCDVALDAWNGGGGVDHALRQIQSFLHPPTLGVSATEHVKSEAVFGRRG